MKARYKYGYLVITTRQWVIAWLIGFSIIAAALILQEVPRYENLYITKLLSM